MNLPSYRQQWLSSGRPQLVRQWQQLLGEPAFPLDAFPSEVTLEDQVEAEGLIVSRYRFSPEPGLSTKAIVLSPKEQMALRPGAVIPFYHPEASAGLLPDSEKVGLVIDPDPSEALCARSYGLHLAKAGFIVVCTEAFPYYTIDPLPATADTFEWWGRAAEALAVRHPDWTGLGKLRHDASCGVSLLLQQPGVDPQRILMMGHSLGGKIAFFTGALDARVTAVIGSDFGVPWDATNWDASWYLGSRVPRSTLSPHHLLAVLAPRPFFLIAGEADNAASWPLLRAAHPYYRLFGPAPAYPDGIDHGEGHSPPPHALARAYAWLAERFALTRCPLPTRPRPALEIPVPIH